MGWILLTIFAGLNCGSFGLPMKFTTKWKWEHTWGMWSFWTLLVIPWVVAFATVPNLFGVYSNAGFKAVFLVFLCGFLWGFSALTFGKGMEYMGLALGYSLMLGLIIVVGSLLPLFTGNSENILKPNGLAIITGVAVIVLGVIFNAWSALIKEKDLAAATAARSSERKSLAKGLIICVVTGIIAPALNYSFIFGDKLMAAAETLGSGKTFASNSIWAIALGGAFIVNTAYCGWLVNKNRSWAKFSEQGTGKYFLYTLIMGILWGGAIEYYGMATANLGKLGPSIGWAVFQATAIFAANILGILTGEWKGVGKKSLTLMIIGLIVLLVGICVLGFANTL